MLVIFYLVMFRHETLEELLWHKTLYSMVCLCIDAAGVASSLILDIAIDRERMVLSSLSFLGGIIVLHQQAVLPAMYWFILSIPILPLAYYWPKYRFLLWFATGFFWASLQATWVYQHNLPAAFESSHIKVIGEIVSVPEKSDHKTRFLFNIQHASNKQQLQWKNPGLARLSWYGKHAVLEPGQIWQLTLKLKKPNGFVNPAGFDYEGWLFQQGINASGYVRNDPGNKLIDNVWNLQSIRYDIHQQLTESMRELKHRGLMIALALGMRGDISQSEWNILQRTGTGHLIAISGLHIGLIAGLCFFISQYCWRLIPSLCLLLPAPKAAAIVAMIGAVVYAFLAGLAIPTQRALVMIFVVMYAILADRNSKPSHVLSLALLFVLIIDSSSVLSQGFWLSFAAVAILVYGMSGRYQHQKGIRSWGRAQWLVSIGLLPLTLFLFQRASIIAPLANIMAIPWVSLLIVPMVLAGTVMLYVFKPVGELLLQISDYCLSPLQWMLSQLSTLSFSQWVQHSPSIAVMLCAILAIILLLAPSGIPVKRLGIILLLPVFVIRPEQIPHAGIRFTVLDVGQGLAAVIETRDHVLVYDTGPKFSDRFDTGSSVVMPYLNQRGIRKLDALVISHADNDHRGGLDSLIEQISVDKLYAGMPEKIQAFSPTLCQRSTHWQWDGVSFTFLHPDNNQRFKKNDRSCVLKIESPGGSILLTGDIHKRSERYMLKTHPDLLKADIMVAPHHGSQSSSHSGFIQAVAAKYVIFASGYKNRFRHPNDKVVARYTKTAAQLLDSANHGAIQFDIGTQSGISEPRSFRQLLSRHWSRSGLSK